MEPMGETKHVLISCLVLVRLTWSLAGGDIKNCARSLVLSLMKNQNT